jgi:hypothetical protein
VCRNYLGFFNFSIDEPLLKKYRFEPREFRPQDREIFSI